MNLYGIPERQRVNTLTSKDFMHNGEFRMKDEQAEPSSMGKGGFPDEYIPRLLLFELQCPRV